MDDFQHQFETGSCSIWRLLFTTSKLGSQCFQCFPAAFQDSVVIFNTLHVGPLSSQTSNWFIEFIQMNMMIGWWSDSGTEFSLFFFLTRCRIFKLLKLPKKGGLKTQPAGFHRMEVPLWRLDQQTRSRAFSSGMPVAEIEEKHLLMTFLLFLVGIPTWAVVVVEFWSTWNLDIYIYIQYTYRYGSISIYVWMYAYGYSTYGMYYYGTVLSSWYQCLQRLSSFIICVSNLHIICILTASSSTMNLLEIFQVKTLSCCRRTFCGAGKRWQEQRPRSNTRSPFRCPGERREWKMDEANVSLLISNDGECHFLGTRGTPRCKKVTEHRYVCFDSKRLDRKEGKEDYSGKKTPRKGRTRLLEGQALQNDGFFACWRTHMYRSTKFRARNACFFG